MSFAQVKTLTVRQRIANPSTPSVTPVGVTASSTVVYKVVFLATDGTTTAASAGGSTAIANANLSPSNYNQVSWSLPPLASGVTVQALVYRTTGGPSQGLIATLPAGVTSLLDTGLPGDSAIPPTANGTGVGDWQSVENIHTLSVQASPSSGWAASINLVASSDLIAADTVDTLDENNRFIEQLNGTYVKLRAEMTSYTSGSLPTVNVIGRP